MPSVLDGGHQIVLANWPNYKRIICTHNNNIPVNIPSHLYVLLDSNILCNCHIEAESNFLLKSLTACGEQENENSDLEMYFTVHLVFENYLDQLEETIDVPIERNWIHQTHVLPISIEPFQMNQNLFQAPKILKEYINQYQENRKSLNMKEKSIKEATFNTFLSSFMVDVILFVTGILTVILTFNIYYYVHAMRTIPIKISGS